MQRTLLNRTAPGEEETWGVSLCGCGVFRGALYTLRLHCRMVGSCACTLAVSAVRVTIGTDFLKDFLWL